MKNIKLGLILTFVLLIIAIFLSKVFKLNEITTSLILGIITGNLFLRKNEHKFNDGFDFASQKILPIAIVCLGVKLNYIILLDLGFKTIGFVFLMVIMLFFTGKYVAKFIWKKEEFGMIIGSGGVSSIAGASKMLNGSEEDFAMAIIGMNILGFTAIIIIPSICKFLGFSNTQAALYIGGTLGSFIQIIPAAYSIGSDTLGLALLIKTGKLLFFPLILIYISKLQKKINSTNNKNDNNPTKTAVKLPFFIKGFMIVGMIFTILQYSTTKIELHWYINLVYYLKIIFGYFFKYLIMFALTGIGAKINIAALLGNGLKLIVFSLTLMVVQLTLGASLVKLFY